jgi:hypothetical protein
VTLLISERCWSFCIAVWTLFFGSIDGGMIVFPVFDSILSLSLSFAFVFVRASLYERA